MMNQQDSIKDTREILTQGKKIQTTILVSPCIKSKKCLTLVLIAKLLMHTVLRLSNIAISTKHPIHWLA